MAKKQSSPQSDLKKKFTTVTPLSKAIALMLFIVLPFAGVLVGMNYQRIYDMAFYSHVTPIVTNSMWTSTITDTDNGMTKYLKVGDKVTANSSNTFDISGLKSSNSSVLENVTDDTFQAMAPGTAVLSTYIRPHCARGMICSQLALQYAVRVIVK